MNVQKKKNCLIVELEGEIDHHAALDIRNETDMRLDSTKAKNLIFDFSEVDFMDSSGVGLVLGRYKAVRKKGGKTALVGASGTIDRIMEISGVYKLMKNYGALSDALNSME